MSSDRNAPIFTCTARDDDTRVVHCSANGESHTYLPLHGQSPEDVARWYARVTGRGVAYYPVKIGERRYAMTDDLGTPPASIAGILDDDERETALAHWYDQRETQLLEHGS